MSSCAELCIRYQQRDTVYNDWQFPMYPSIGIVALFSGRRAPARRWPPRSIAGELGLDLYKIDLVRGGQQVHRRDREEPRRGSSTPPTPASCVLFFDEADALFGKRSEVTRRARPVRQHRGRYLLQRMEAYDGLVVLATNLRGNIDEAFLRRHPRRASTSRCPSEPSASASGVTCSRRLRRSTTSTSTCSPRSSRSPAATSRNAALQRPSSPPTPGDPITMDWVIRALKREFQKMGRLRTEADFGKYRTGSRQPTRSEVLVPKIDAERKRLWSGGGDGGGETTGGGGQSVLGLQQTIGNQQTVKSVLGPDVVTEFRGELAGHGTAGPLFMTTSTYKQLAKLLSGYAAKFSSRSAARGGGPRPARSTTCSRRGSGARSRVGTTEETKAKREHAAMAAAEGEAGARGSSTASRRRSSNPSRLRNRNRRSGPAGHGAGRAGPGRPREEGGAAAQVIDEAGED